ncbi:MAG TPA: (4Fe-4S)-binding protein [Fimbriimonadaceae bacterium]|nr:(4Fe-4S)-binding protein [Fimbriimonadaceae bacterium]
MVLEYSNGEITILWEPDKCIHSGKCVRGLPAVFDPKRRPWIIATNATTEQLIAQVEQCPSGALTWRRDVEP